MGERGWSWKAESVLAELQACIAERDPARVIEDALRDAYEAGRRAGAAKVMGDRIVAQASSAPPLAKVVPRGNARAEVHEMLMDAIALDRPSVVADAILDAIEDESWRAR